MNIIEKKYGLKIWHAISLLVILVLNVIWLVCSTITSIKANETLTVSQAANIIMFAAAAYYAIDGYRRPHGNLMRYLLICSAVFTGVQFISHAADGKFPVYVSVALFAAAILKAYMAGRLDHFKENLIISIAVLACEFVTVFYIFNLFHSMEIGLTFVRFMYYIGPITLWLAIAASYILRYRLHKEAGSEEKSTK